MEEQFKVLEILVDTKWKCDVIEKIKRLSDSKVFFVNQVFKLDKEVSIKIMEFYPNLIKINFGVFYKDNRLTTIQCPIDEFETQINSFEISNELRKELES